MKGLIIGIDPGGGGGVAVLDREGNVVDVFNMHETPFDIYQSLKEYAEDTSVCFLERVGGMPGQSGSAMFNFGKNFGYLEMALLSLGIKTEVVTPQKWQRHYQFGSSSITKSSAKDKHAHKVAMKCRAQQLFPSLGKKVTLKTCDALLIAEYGRRIDVN